MGEREFFVPFSDFPWFASATVAQLVNVEQPHSHCVRWPNLDVDLALESLEHPDRYRSPQRRSSQRERPRRCANRDSPGEPVTWRGRPGRRLFRRRRNDDESRFTGDLIRPLKPAALALVVCVIAAALEGLAAGPGVKQRLAALRVPRWALPFSAWLVVGGLYYVLCFIVLFRILELPTTRLQVTTLAVATTFMTANAAWNYLFFRRANLYASFVFFLPYAALALALFGLLLRVDPVSSAIFGPYLLYFVYATAWGYKVWQLNRRPANGSPSPKPAA